MSLIDRNCIERCLDGHPEEYRLLVQRYQSVLLAYLTGWMGDRDRAEEAAQETFVRAYFRLNTLKSRERFYSWLLGIASRVAKEQFRSEQRHQNMVEMAKSDRTKTEFSQGYLLEKAVSVLPNAYKEIVLLRYYSDLSCAEVAQQLDRPLGTVTKMLSRAYEMLRKELLEEVQK